MIAAFLLIAGFLATCVISMIWRGYVLSILWGWFIVPTFGLPHLAITVALGISLMITLITVVSPTKKDGTTFGDSVLNAFMGPMMALALGFIVTLFI